MSVVRLSDHFTLAELTVTLHRDIDNSPPSGILVALTDTAAHMEEVRRVLGMRPISVSSGYRSPALNKAVGGAATSAHMTGHAVDFNCFSFGDPLAVCKAISRSSLPFDQLIEEGGWVHISFAPKMRRQVLTKREGGGYHLGLAA